MSKSHPFRILRCDCSRQIRCDRASRLCLVAALATGLVRPGEPAPAEESPAYVIEVTDVSSKVGEHGGLHATLRIRDGYRILQGYNNRVIELSS